MEQAFVKYYDGVTARSQAAVLTLNGDNIDVHNAETNAFLQFISLNTSTVTYVQGQMYLYPDALKQVHVVIPANHPDFESIKEILSRQDTGWFHRLMKVRGVSLLLLLVGLFVAFYFVMITVIPVVGMHFISTKKEVEMGRQLSDRLLSNYAIDEDATKAAQAFADDLTLSNIYPLKITVVEEGEVNAFALPGGQIVIYAGILKEMKSYDELAALLGHEVTHINKRHTLRSILRSMSSSLMLSLLTANGNGISGVIINNASQLNNLSYSRSLEEEADMEGMKLLLVNNISPEAMLHLMEHLKASAPDVPKNLSFLSNHPLTTERIKVAEKFSREHPLVEPPRDDLKAQWDLLEKAIDY